MGFSFLSLKLDYLSLPLFLLSTLNRVALEVPETHRSPYP